MKELYDRMPAVLMKEEFTEWLNPDNHDIGALSELLRSYPDDGNVFHEVSKEVNNVRNNAEHLPHPC